MYALKIVFLDVSNLSTNQEKDALVENFIKYGWESRIQYDDKIIGKTRIILGYELTWWLNSEPFIPDIPKSCMLFNIS